MEKELFQEETVSKAYISLSLPLALSMVVTLIYNLADTFFVAQTGDTNLIAGVSLGVPVFTLLMAVGNIFGQGGSSVISRLLGQKDRQGIRVVSAFCFYGTILTGVLFGAAMLGFRRPIVSLLGADADTFHHASSYYTCLALGAPAVMLSFIHSNLLRSEGMSRESMTGTILGAVINIVLDPIFITVLGLGASGAAIATVIGYLASDLYFAVIVVRKSAILSVSPRDFRVPVGQVGQIFGIGIPAAISNVMQSVSVVFVNQFLLPYGNDKIATMGIVLKVSMIGLLLLTGFAFGGQPLFGYYYGAGDKARLSQLLRFCVKFITVLALALTVGMMVFAPALLRCFVDNDAVVADGTVMLRFQVVTMAFVGMILLMTIICQSMGKVLCSFFLTVSRQGIVFLIVLLVANHTAGYVGILASQAISDGISALLALAVYHRYLRKEFHADAST